MAEVLVVHCVDAEGPLGGNARRNPDGSPEFYDNWRDIRNSLRKLTDGATRHELRDSFGKPYRFTWFTMDFSGFKTNPKCRDTTRHAVYDTLRSLPTSLDEFGWHHHCPPESGIGDEWADRWDPTEAEKQLEALRIERGHIPRVFRAGGCIEDNALSRWLEGRFLLDFSNRVSERSTGKGGLNSFDWYGAPMRWGSYQPNRENFLEDSLIDVTRLGDVARRYILGDALDRHIYRCIDARSRYNELTAAHCDEAFEQAKRENRPSVLSFFSHDNREMGPETREAVRLIREAAVRHDASWRICTASEAHRLHHEGNPNG